MLGDSRVVFIHFQKKILVLPLTVCLQLAAFRNRLKVLRWQSVNLLYKARSE